MTKFELAHKFTAKWEGGLSDDPADKGGITKYGVSIEFLKDCYEVDANKLEEFDITPLPVSRQTIKNLTKQQAMDLFWWRFWDKLRLDRFNVKLAIVLYDCAVNHGISRAVKFVQQACNSLGENIEVDGKLGNVTTSVILAVDQEHLANYIIGLRKAFYRRIVDNNPSQSVFLKGWLNRANDLGEYIKGI